MNEDSEYVRSFIPLVHFLGAALGSNTEVVLHDVTNPESSVIAIANGHVSGRSVGSPATDLMLKVLNDGMAQHKDYIAGYPGHVSHSEHSLVSSTYFIRRNDRIVGTICVNTDQTAFLTLKRSIEQIEHAYLPTPNVEETSETYEENLAVSVEDMAMQVFNAMSAENGIPVTKFSVDDRLKAMRTLNSRGYFQFKGAVSNVANLMGVSESTAYRYLRMAQAE
ncbi:MULTISPECIES: helix-turn-helix transcriptional regulator [Bifidobacterium]|nr:MULTISPECIES: helix-turn-helix transcriptional regulator [Bifidobacterium]